MKRLTFSQYQRAQMDRHAKRTAVVQEYGEVTSRTAAGRYTLSVRGLSSQGMTAIGGEFAPGQTVRVSRGGPGSASYQIDGAPPLSRRANRAAVVFDTAITTSTRLR